MRQLLQNIRDGKTTVEEVPVPTPRDGTALVKVAASLVSAGTVEVRVPPSWGEAGWGVHLESPAGSFAWSPQSSSSSVGEERKTTLYGVPAGRWVVVVRTGSATHRREVVVAAEGTTVVEMGP